MQKLRMREGEKERDLIYSYFWLLNWCPFSLSCFSLRDWQVSRSDKNTTWSPDLPSPIHFSFNLLRLILVKGTIWSLPGCALQRRSLQNCQPGADTGWGFAGWKPRRTFKNHPRSSTKQPNPWGSVKSRREGKSFLSQRLLLPQHGLLRLFCVPLRQHKTHKPTQKRRLTVLLFSTGELELAA